MNSSSQRIVIVGAGLAGLACAQKLVEADFDVILLEARDRLGGRAYQHESSSYHPPLEFGAEYIHGAPSALLKLLEQESFVDVNDEHLSLRQGRLRSHKDYWGLLEKVTAKLNPHPSKDRSIKEFLKKEGQRLLPEKKELFAAYVEGFHAADLNLIGEKSLALSEKEEEGALNGRFLFRLQNGTSSIIEKIGARLEAKIKLQHRVKRIDWGPDKAEVIVQNNWQEVHFTARHVVLTAPIGVLKSLHPESHIELNPVIPEFTKALSTLHMGHVQKINFIFKKRFWETLSKEPVSFLHTGPEFYFPTWWTQSPVRSPVLVAWQGGPKALEMSLWPEQKVIEMAFKTLSKISKRSMDFLKENLVAHHWHNWSEDPFALGAYSYLGVQSSRSHWNKPFQDFLWLAGEGTAKNSQQGTMHGAIESGWSAAKEIIKREKPAAL
ncbi:flavin monoamine oxidase family protein [Bdellovibrio bacteriovorus]|uniref:flavin monoamine oxidase family protein n=1 Tax=Bdellovibrio bacteriovorus TaxID=959 RepID=UPI0035A60DD5